ncbi:MAG: hypothetical protein ACPGQK_08590 [Paracoccaceae bacterium]
MDILKNPTFWMFLAAVVLINTFISPRNLDNWGGFVRVASIVSIAAVLYVSCHVGLLYPHARLFSEKRTVVYYALFWIFLIVFIVVAFVVWMAPILEPCDVPNFNGVDEMYPVVLIHLVIFEWLFYYFFADHRKTRHNSGYRNRSIGGSHS